VPDSLYVLSIDAEKNRVVVGAKDALLAHALTLRGVNWLGEGEAMPDGGFECHVKLRSMAVLIPAAVTPLAGGRAEVRLREPYSAIAPGQACVFYEGERVLGGGWIEKG
ncbi:MAG: tRNA 2-thiouridine(34) synthase MnmA, partial [Rhodospirillales bacterium]|nr:tRNA 2-thiouridine(34) synthase MnmA [Rhodospirillales bacterium]